MLFGSRLSRHLCHGMLLIGISSSFWAASPLWADSNSQDLTPAVLLVSPLPLPAKLDEAAGQPKIQWGSLFAQSGVFLGVQEGFRLATEAGTREGLKGPFWQNYLDAVGNLHGWSDGDEFMVNYIGHPMDGAVAGYIFSRNDPKFKRVEFGRSAAYWKGRFRAGAFAWAFSAQSEIGLVSEASIGGIQRYYPAVGFVDYVITLAMGMGWMAGEDALDKYLVKYIESKTSNVYARMLVRSWLNPARSFANMMAFHRPWDRESRPGVTAYDPSTWTNACASKPYAKSTLAQGFVAPANIQEALSPSSSIFPVFELAPHADFISHAGSAEQNEQMIGGGATALFSLKRWLGFVVDISGYKMLSPGQNQSGDSLLYLFGPRLMYRNSDRWTLYLECLAGGNKLTREHFYPEKLAAAKAQNPEWEKLNSYIKFDETHTFYETNAPALAMGGGFDVGLNRVLAFRICNLQYVATTNQLFGAGDYSHQVRLSTGFTLRFGAW